MTCPYCGAENEAGFQFCKTCGAKLAPKAVPQQPQYQAPQQPQYQAPQYQAPQQPQYQPPQYQAPQYQAPQYQAPQQPQYQAPQYRPQQPQGYAPAAPAAPKQPKQNPFAQIAAKAKAIDFKGLLKDPKKLIIPGAAVAAVLVLVILVSIIASSGGNASVPKMTYYTVETDGEYMLLCDDKIIEEGLEDAYIYASSLDGTVALYESDYELFAVRGKKSVSLTDDWYTVQLSINGDYAAITDYDDVLTIYNTKNGDATEIAEDVELFCISPDGKTVVYVVYDDGDYVTYLYKGKNSVELGEDLYPLSVSNGGKYIYCYNSDKYSLVTVDAKGNTEKIANDMSTNRVAYLNEDHTQIIFYADGKWYASVKGGEKIKLSSESYFSIATYQYSSYVFVNSDGLRSCTYPTADLRNHFVSLGDTVSYLNSKWELTKAAKDVESAYVTADGKTLIYLRDNSKLYKVTSNKLDDPVELADDVYEFAITSDGSAVYFTNYDDELMYQKGTKDAKRVADDVEGMIVTPDDYCLFGSDDSTLYSTRNGGKKVKITDELEDMDISATVIYIWTDYDDGECNIFAATKGAKFKAIYEY